MKDNRQNRVLHLLYFLYQYADEEHSVSVTDILRYWQKQGIQAGCRSVRNDIALLKEFGVEIICVKGDQD